MEESDTTPLWEVRRKVEFGSGSRKVGRGEGVRQFCVGSPAGQTARPPRSFSPIPLLIRFPPSLDRLMSQLPRVSAVLLRSALVLWVAGHALPLVAQAPQEGGAAPVAGQQAGGVPAPAAAYSHDQAPMAQAVRLTGSVSIDGDLSDPFWGSVPPIIGLRQTTPLEGESVSEHTEVRIAYDDEAIYVAARLEDRNPVTTRLVRRDAGLGDSDSFVILFDSYHDHETAYRFSTNPSGVKGDAIVTGNSTGGGDSSWDPIWELSTRVTDYGWAVEMRIPFSQLRFSPEEIQVWGFQVERRINRNQETATFPFTPLLERAGVARFAHLHGIEGIRPGRRLELLPYVVARGEYLQLSSPAGAPFSNPYRSGRDHFSDAGLDLKYRLTSNVTLDATVNPDFGQVELDPSVINLTAFETQFSERRPFFVEGSDIFSFGEGGPTGSVGRGPDILYSRRIGTRPRGSAPSSALYSDQPIATTILGAAKVTGRLEGGWSVGILQAFTGEESAAYVDALGERHSLMVEPAANYFVARVRRQIRGGQTRFGAIASAVNRNPDGTPLQDQLHSAGYATGVDFATESRDRAWIFSGLASVSLVQGDSLALRRTQQASRRYYQRVDATHLSVDPSAESMTGYYLMGYIGKQAGNFTMRNAVAIISPGYEVNDVGFHTNADRVLVDTHYQWTDRVPGRYLRTWNVSGSPDAVFNTNGDRVFANFNTQLNLDFMNYWRTTMRLQWDPRTRDDRLTRGGPMAHSPKRFDARVTLNSDSRRRVTVGTNVGMNRDEAGSWGRNASMNVNVRPSETIQFRVSPSVSRSFSAAQYVTRIVDPLATATAGGRYVFAELDRTTVSLETTLNLTLSPTFSLQLYIEPFISTGDYGTLREFRAPRTYEFLDYGRDIGTVTVDSQGRYEIDPDGAGPAPIFRIADRDFSVRSLLGNAVLRWEWRPGSTVFLVWQQERVNSLSGQGGADGPLGIGRFDLSRDVADMFDVAPNNVLMVKVTYWLNP